jgi:hypothetical protein
MVYGKPRDIAKLAEDVNRVLIELYPKDLILHGKHSFEYVFAEFICRSFTAAC